MFQTSGIGILEVLIPLVFDDTGFDYNRNQLQSTRGCPSPEQFQRPDVASSVSEIQGKDMPGNDTDLMHPATIIKIAHELARHYWRVDRGLDYAAFKRLLKQPNVKALIPSHYSHLTKYGKCVNYIMDQLREPLIQEKIEEALDYPGLFQCKSAEEIEKLVVARSSVNHQNRPTSNSLDSVISLTAEMYEALHLSAKEEKEIKHLQGVCMQPEHNVICWGDAPPIGTSFLAYAFATTQLFHKVIDFAFVIQPHEGMIDEYLRSGKPLSYEQPFERALLQVAERLGLAGRPSAATLLGRLSDRRGVIIVLDANSIPETRSSYVRELLDQALLPSFRRRPKSCVPIVLVGSPPGQRTTSRLKHLAGLKELIAFTAKSTREQTSFFELQLKRFSHHRGTPQIGTPGNVRLKTAQRHYGSDNGALVLPSTLRMLAFLASNTINQNSFDPTSGWLRQSGMPVSALPVEIWLHLAEVVTHARSVSEEGKRNPALRALRWCSTALYWFTEEAAEDLGRLAPRTNLESFRAATDTLKKHIEFEPQAAERPPEYKMDMALRAVVQNRWANCDPFGRAITHHRISLRLMESSHSKELLSTEYPLRPHWGRSRIHFLAESLRHLVRSCEHAPRSATNRVNTTTAQEDFPKPPGKPGNWRKQYAEDVMNYCFSQIFWLQLNGNKATGTINNRKLSRQHGAYQLTAELLQLMSEDGELGKPHWALNAVNRQRYLREVAYTQLDLGELQAAKASFERLIAAWREEDGDRVEGIAFKLDLAIALSAMGDLSLARKTLGAVRDEFYSLLSEGGNSMARRSRMSIKTRIDAREAHLRYLEGDLDGALQACMKIEKANPGAIARDVAHTYIATLGALGGESRLKLATAICVRNVFDNTTRGLHHEALGFRVALGHAFRRLQMLEVAEVVLDQVHSDVQLYGCSERTYLAFLIEAGRVVFRQRRFARAYAAYLRPCFDRARSRGFYRNAEISRSYARRCLEELLALLSEPTESDWIGSLRSELEGRAGIPSNDGASAEVDSKSSLDTASSDEWLSRLGSSERIRAELRQLQEV